MNTQNDDRHTASGSDENNETMDFIAGKLDKATPCPADTGARIESEVPGSATTDKIHE